MHYISNFSNLIFLFKLLISFFSHQHNLWFLEWSIRMCCNMNVRLQLIRVNFSFMNSNIKMFDSTFRLAKIFFIISIVLKSVNFNFLTNFFSNSCNCFWNSSLHSYSSFDFDRFLYEYDVLDLLKARRTASFIFCVFANVLSDAVSFKIFYNLSIFSIW